MQSRAGSIALVALLSLAPLAACDNEDARDVKEGVKNVGEGVDDTVDKIDDDGKDD